jgi:hypothetical protein
MKTNSSSSSGFAPVMGTVLLSFVLGFLVGAGLILLVSHSVVRL